MEFTVPQFIERKPRILGPFNFKQLIYVSIAGAGSFLAYYSVPFVLFIFISIILISGALALCFLKIKGYTLPVLLKNFLIYTISSRIFVWQRKILRSKIKKMGKFEKIETEEENTLKITKKSRLQKLSTQVETKIIK